jgi:pimeloyl-ACP methyl ester carboxylesterase
MPFVTAGDLNTYYVERGQGEAVLFVHGNWTTSSSWKALLERMPAGWRAIAYDVRGRGKTEGPDSDYTIPELAADLRAFADALGLQSFHLVSHSLGSAIAMQFALESPERVKTLTVISPAWVDGMPDTPNLAAGQQAIKADKNLYSQALKMMMPTLTDEEYFKQLVDEGHEQRTEATMRNIPALLSWRLGDRLKEIGVPTLVISGELDPLTGGANAERATAALGARHIRLMNVGHSPNIEVPDKVVELLTAHISGRTPDA